MADYPYMMSNNKIPLIIDKIISAAKPPRFTQEFLSNMGFTSSNDRAFTPVLKKLGFLTEDSVPTQYYDQLRDRSTSKIILADRIKSLYSELYSINTSIHAAPEAEIKGAISRVTGKDETGVMRIYNTFKTLCSNAEFLRTLSDVHSNTIVENRPQFIEPISQPTASSNTPTVKDFHYNI